MRNLWLSSFAIRKAHISSAPIGFFKRSLGVVTDLRVGRGTHHLKASRTINSDDDLDLH
jgi:hypothetical protein